MRTIKCLSSLLLSILILLTVTACDGTDRAYIYFSLNEQPKTLDPQTASSDTELMIVRNIFEGLLRKDEDGKIVCGVAESYKKSNLTYTFKIRKDAIWSNGQNITAHDFVFALRRAVDPKTKSPFVRRLFCIINAKEINSGQMNIENFGVKAIDNYTLQITLCEYDNSFEETLTTSLAMPCNENFFNESAGKYGIFKEYTLSNGSYKLSKWGKEIFGIRLYRNSTYTGSFIAKNAAVFISQSKDDSTLNIIKSNEADIAFINSAEITEAKKANLNTASIDNNCWFLTISDGLSKGIRKSLISLANPQIVSQKLFDGYSSPQTIFPPALNANASISGMPVYDLEAAKTLYANEILNLTDKKFSSDVILYYYDDGYSKKIATDIVGHWQNHLGVFINIEAVSSPEVLLSQLKEQTYALCIFPVSADSPNIYEYLEKFGIDYDDSDLTKLQTEILASNNISPLLMQSTVIAFQKQLESVNFMQGNGMIDFAYIVKRSS